MLNDLRQDLRYACRRLLKTPGFTTSAVFTLALAIGAATAVFSVVNAVLLRPLPYPESHRLVEAGRAFPSGTIGWWVSVPKFVFWRERGDVFDHLTAYDLSSGFSLTGTGVPERIVGTRVTRDFFSTLGSTPALGRDFVAEEDRPGGPRVVVLSHALWQHRFGGRTDVVGQSVRLNGEAYTVVGVMPEDFSFTAYQFNEPSELWTPLQLDVASRGVENTLLVLGRLAPHVTADEALAAMRMVAERYRGVHPDDMNPNETVAVEPLQGWLTGSVRDALLVLFAAVAAVFLIACLNVAALQLAQIVRREREMALRTALGASAGHIVRAVLSESLLVGVAGCALGVLVAWWAVPALLALAPEGLPRLNAVALDARVLAFALGLALVTGLGCGMLPALAATRRSLERTLREGSAGAGRGTRAARTRRVLVVSEVAMALMLTTVAALLITSFAGLLRTDPGFRGEGVLTMKVSLPESYGSSEALARVTEQIEERVGGVSGAGAVATSILLPLQPVGLDMPFTIDGRYEPGTEEGVGEALYRAVGPRYFDVLQIAVRRGRSLDERDRRGAPLVAIVNEAAARTFWPEGSPIGERITMGQPFVPQFADATPREIVGVVADVHELGLAEPPAPIVYVPISQMASGLAALLPQTFPVSVSIRAEASASTLAREAQRAVWAVDPELPITDVEAMSGILSRSLAGERFSTLLVGLLATAALVLAAAGLYAVLAYLVSQRRREVGVRMALGATDLDVLTLFLREGVGLALAGLLVGLVGTFVVTRFLRSLLTGVGSLHPPALAAAALVTLLVALAASWLPARRAGRTDPLHALREE